MSQGFWSRFTCTRWMTLSSTLPETHIFAPENKPKPSPNREPDIASRFPLASFRECNRSPIPESQPTANHLVKNGTVPFWMMRNPSLKMVKLVNQPMKRWVGLPGISRYHHFFRGDLFQGVWPISNHNQTHRNTNDEPKKLKLNRGTFKSRWASDDNGLIRVLTLTFCEKKLDQVL